MVEAWLNTATTEVLDLDFIPKLSLHGSDLNLAVESLVSYWEAMEVTQPVVIFTHFTLCLGIMGQVKGWVIGSPQHTVQDINRRD